MQIGVGDNKILCNWDWRRAGLEAGKGAKAEMENLNAKVGNGYV